MNGAMTRPSERTRTNTSGRSHHVTVEAVRDAAHGVPVEGHGHSPPIRSRTGARSQTRTGTHSHSRTWRLLPSWLLCPSCLHTQPLLRRHRSGVEKDSTTATRIVAGSRQNDPVRSRHRQRVRRRLAAHHAGVASSVRLSVSSLAGVDVPRVGGGAPRSRWESVATHASAGILVCRRQGLTTLCTLLSCGASAHAPRAGVRDGLEDEAAGRGDRTGGGHTGEG